jgi:hypothetical protein
MHLPLTRFEQMPLTVQITGQAITFGDFGISAIAVGI